jgi:hypothetical protein
MAQQKAGELLARLPQHAHRRQSRAHQIADRLMGWVWNPDQALAHETVFSRWRRCRQIRLMEELSPGETAGLSPFSSQAIDKSWFHEFALRTRKNVKWVVELRGFEPMAIAGAGRSRATESDGGHAPFRTPPRVVNRNTSFASSRMPLPRCSTMFSLSNATSPAVAPGAAADCLPFTTSPSVSSQTGPTVMAYCPAS